MPRYQTTIQSDPDKGCREYCGDLIRAGCISSERREAFHSGPEGRWRDHPDRRRGHGRRMLQEVSPR
ncbi:MAG: hypothetical protein MZU84_01880 [Sphingobacterium sp.]|nr:hypothetical protein [Sphingobacterium sp.]